MRATAYVYQWKENDAESWTIYEVTTATGQDQVRAWIVAHGDALRRGAAMGSQLAWRPRDLLVEMQADATAAAKHYLLRRYPIDAKQPESAREYKVNLTDGDIEELRAIFTKHGAPSQKNFDDSVDGG